MKRFVTVLITLVLMCQAACSVAAVDVTSVTIIGTHAFETRAELQVRLLAGTGQDALYSSLQKTDLSFTVNNTAVPIKTDPIQNQGTSYIFVVDCALYYSQRFKFEHVISILNAAINAMETQDRCAFVLVNSSVRTNAFTDKESALTFVQSITQEKKKGECKLYDGISQAIDMAGIVSDSIPDQKVIVVLSDAIDEGSSTQLDALQEKLITQADAPLISLVMFRSGFSTDKKDWRSTIDSSRDSLINLSSLTDGFYRIIDFDESEISSVAQGAGQRVAAFGKSVIHLTLDITDVSLISSSDNQYSLAVYYTGGGQTLANTQTVTIYGSQVPTPTPAPTPEPVIEENPIKFGKDADGAQVRYIQYKLQQLYYFTGTISGVYDAETQAALDAFYLANGLPVVDGMSVAGYDLLEAGGAVAQATATPEPADPNQKFKMGDNGPEVRDAQYLLEKLGYYQSTEEKDSEIAFGTFDQRMQLATDSFCRENGLSTSDGMSTECWELLNSQSAKPAATPTPTPGPTIDPRLKLELGDQNADVRNVQAKLESLYYYSPDEDGASYGVFDTALLKAVDNFCRDYDLETMDGMSHEAYNLLMNGNPQPRATAEPVAEYIDLRPGDSNSYVNEYQIRLKSLNYFDGDFTPGIYDEATQAAQDRLCTVNEMASEIGASISLQKIIASETIKPNVPLDLMTRIRKFLLGTMQLWSLTIPMWVVVLICTALFAGVIVLIVLLLQPSRRKKKAPPTPEPYAVSSGDGLNIAEDRPTTDMNDFGATNTDPPTSVNVGGWPITLMIDYAGVSTDATYTLEDNTPLIIGRGSDADIHLSKDDLTVSRHHGQLVYRGGMLCYQDTSKLGTYVDGQFINNADYTLHPGSVLEIGKHRIKTEMK